MLADIEKFIYNDKIYSKCSAADKEMIDTCLHGVRQQLETFKEAYKQAQDEIALLKRENKALADDNELKCELNEKLDNALDKACGELTKMCKQTKCKDCHFVQEQIDCENDCPVQGNLTYWDWKEWAMND